MDPITRRSFVGGGLAVGAVSAVPFLSSSSDLTPLDRQDFRAAPIESRAFTSSAGPFTISPGGLDGGGQVTGIDVASDGWMVSRNDTQTANIRAPNAISWENAFRWGENISMEDFVFRGPQEQVYEIRFAPGDSTTIWALAFGYLLKSTDRAASWKRVTAFKNGVYDETQSYTEAAPYAKLSGQHILVDPVDKNLVAVAHPVDGLYYSTDGGATWQVNHSVPPPINVNAERRGINLAADAASIANGKAQTIVATVPGRGIYRSKTGINGKFSLVDGLGAPPLGYAQDVEVANGKIYVVGDGNSNNEQLFLHNGSVWTQPSGIAGNSVDARPGAPNTVLIISAGGGMFMTTDGGVNWDVQNNIPCTYDTPDVPWLAVTNAGYLGLGQMRWHPTLNRVLVVNGIGAFYFDNPPRTASKQKFQSITLGIRQMLVMDLKVTPTGRVLVACQDRPVFQFTRATVKEQATRHGPNYTDIIRHADSVDFAKDNENYQVVTYTRGNATPDTIMISQDGGKTYNPPKTTPKFKGENVVAGNVAVGNAGNIVWAPTSDSPMFFTKDGGTSWHQPIFGNSVDMTGAIWHHWYVYRRNILWNDPANPLRFLAHCWGDGNGDGDPADLAHQGLWESLDGGEHFTRIRPTRFFPSNQDFYSFKLRPVPGFPEQMFIVRGNAGSYPSPPAPDGLLFSSSKGVTTVNMKGFWEVEDIGFGKAKDGNPYPRLMARGWRMIDRALTLATWECNDFNPNSPRSATWTLHLLHPGGRADQGQMIFGDMGLYGRFYHVPQGGGFFVDDFLSEEVST